MHVNGRSSQKKEKGNISYGLNTLLQLEPQPDLTAGREFYMMDRSGLYVNNVTLRSKCSLAAA